MESKPFPMPKKLEIEKSTNTEMYAKFTAQPLQAGFGHTLGNALRRVLLSSLEGAAISAVKIEGVSHEFTSIPNVKEDVTEIVLNLKRIKLKLLDGVETPRTIEIQASKAGPVLAGDIAYDNAIEVLNPNQIICTLDKDVPFRAEIEITTGRRWSPAEKNKRPEQPIGTIPIDALYSPVTAVRYQVGDARVGEDTEMDSLVIEVFTDGRVSAKDAVQKAAFILKEHLRPFLGESAVNVNDTGNTLSAQNAKLFKNLSKPIEILELSVRGVNCLNNANIKIIGELCSKSEQRLLKYRNCGQKTLDEIKDKLAKLDLSLGMTFDDELNNAVQAEADRIKNAKKEEA